MKLEGTTITASLLAVLESAQNNSADLLLDSPVIQRQLIAPSETFPVITEPNPSSPSKTSSNKRASIEEATNDAQDKRPRLAVKTLGSSTPGRSDRSSRSRRDRRSYTHHEEDDGDDDSTSDGVKEISPPIGSFRETFRDRTRNRPEAIPLCEDGVVRTPPPHPMSAYSDNAFVPAAVEEESEKFEEDESSESDATSDNENDDETALMTQYVYSGTYCVYVTC